MNRPAPRLVAARALAAALLLLTLAPLGIPINHSARAADRGLVALMQTRYDPLPGSHLVRVTIDAVATSYTPDTSEGRTYYPAFSFSVPAAATRFSASSGGQRLSVRIVEQDADVSQLKITFSHGVFYQQSYAFRVVFELPDVGGEPDRDIFVGSNIVAFPVWAYGSPGEPGSGVKVILPAGFRAIVQGSEMATSAGSAGEVVLTASGLADPFEFFAYLSADRPGTFGEQHLVTTIAGQPAPLWIRNWEDDPDWGVRMAALMIDGLPALQELVGLPYAVGGTLIVEEAAATRLGDYAGIYNELTGMIRVRYDADAYIGLHEAAHLWFNTRLFEERWINEAWAEFYAVEAADAIGAEGVAFGLTDALLESQIPLNDWGVPGAVDPDVEYFAYAASYHVAGLIFARTDFEGLRSAWRGVANGEMSYQPAQGSGVPDEGVNYRLARWQQLLDLLEERTGASFDDIWTDWVVNRAQEALMEDRAAARDGYALLVEQADDWNLPSDLRYAMSSWEFDEADAQIDLAGDVLADRDEIVAQAGELSLEMPGDLEAAFEGEDGLAAAK